MQAPYNMERGCSGSPVCVVGLSLPANHAEVRKGLLWVNVSTAALLQESFH